MKYCYFSAKRIIYDFIVMNIFEISKIKLETFSFRWKLYIKNNLYAKYIAVETKSIM